MSTKLAHFNFVKKFLNNLIVGVMKVYWYFAFASAFLDEHITQIKLKGSRTSRDQLFWEMWENQLAPID